MFEFLKRFRAKRKARKEAEKAARWVKPLPPGAPITRPARPAYAPPREVERTVVSRSSAVRISAPVYESSVEYYPTPLYLPMDLSPSVEVCAPAIEVCVPVVEFSSSSSCFDSSSSYSSSSFDSSSSYDCSSSSIDYGSSSGSDSW